MTPAPDTSRENCERLIALAHQAIAADDPDDFQTDAVRFIADGSAVLRALLARCEVAEAERDEARRIANGGCARDQRTTQYCGIAADAYARGFREGATTIREKIAMTFDAVAAEPQA